MFRSVLTLTIAVSGLIFAATLWGHSTRAASVVDSDESGPSEVGQSPTTVAEARRQASLLHETYIATLLAVHREYFDADERDTLPARVLEDVFSHVDEQTKGRTRWISVNAPAMNSDHEPAPGFEADAAKALSGESQVFERLENGLYHRAAAVPLVASCTKCHLSGLSQRRSGRVAALVITLPIVDE